MKQYIVLYHDSEQNVQSFACKADDFDHAEEQTTNAYPNADIILVHQGNSASFKGIRYTLS